MDAEESQKEIQAIGELILGLGGRESNSRRGVTTRASPEFEAGTAQETEGCSCSRTGPRLARRFSGTPRRRRLSSAGQTGRDGDGA